MTRRFGSAWRIMAVAVVFALTVTLLASLGVRASPGESIPPTLRSITWLDNDSDGTINAGDDLVFHFSESMNEFNLSNINQVNERLNSSAAGSTDYGITGALTNWTVGETVLTVTLGDEENIDGGETVNPTNDVKDKQGNSDATSGSGPSIPLPPDTTAPTLLSITWVDDDGDGTINKDDYLVFHFSEAMYQATVTSGDIDTTLPLWPAGYYGFGAGAVWDPSGCWLTVTLADGSVVVGGLTVNPAATVTDMKGNPDETLVAPSVPLAPDTTEPTLIDIGWNDIDPGGLLSGGDELVMSFSEAMNEGTITDGTVNAVLDTTASGGADYGGGPEVQWNTARTKCTVTLDIDHNLTPTGGDMVYPTVAVTDKKGNSADTTTGQAIPTSPSGATEETTKPTLLSITWTDTDSDGTINKDDKLVFHFSEAMKKSTIDATNVNTVLPSTAPGSTDYGAVGAANWNTSGTSLSVTLGVTETVTGGETVNPTAAVTDAKGNIDNTSGAGPAIPLAPDTTKPTLLSVTWTDNDSDGIINESDFLVFNFSEAMGNTSVPNPNTDLPTSPAGYYGAVPGTAWSCGDTVLTLTLDVGAFFTGGETVNPMSTVTDRNGNSDNTSSPAIPLMPDTTPPMLLGISWVDVDGSSFIDSGDNLIFHFSESMNHLTITDGNVNAVLDSTAPDTADYGTTPTVAWNSSIWTECTVTLDDNENIDGGETVDPKEAVTDRRGLSDATMGGGPSIPTEPGAPTPTPTPTATPTTT
ncbi:MAG: hypothetical protein SVP26_03235, partial [Chloroflexota bacterium]|nr:hypothetical protein [Chloroflexota bacterium]